MRSRALRRKPDRRPLRRPDPETLKRGAFEHEALWDMNRAVGERYCHDNRNEKGV